MLHVCLFDVTTYLFLVSQTTSNEGHAQDEQKVREDRAEKGGLDDTNFILQ